MQARVEGWQARVSWDVTRAPCYVGALSRQTDSVSVLLRGAGWSPILAGALLPPPCSLLPPPCSLLPAPCSPLPTPCSLHPTPYSLLPAPCSLLPASHCLLPAPYFLLPTPYSLLPTPCSLLPSSLLPAACSLLPTAYSLLPTSCLLQAEAEASLAKALQVLMLLPTSYFLLTTGRGGSVARQGTPSAHGRSGTLPIGRHLLGRASDARRRRAWTGTCRRRTRGTCLLGPCL